MKQSEITACESFVPAGASAAATYTATITNIIAAVSALAATSTVFCDSFCRACVSAPMIVPWRRSTADSLRIATATRAIAHGEMFLIESESSTSTTA